MRKLFYRMFRYTERLARAFDIRVLPAGKLLTGVIVVGAIFGADPRKSLAFQVFAFALALMVIAFIETALTRPRVRASRIMPARGAVGVPLTYRLTVTNTARGRFRGGHVWDDAKWQWPSFDEMRSSREPKEQQRNFIDRYIGYYRWVWLLKTRRPARFQRAAVPALPPGASLTITNQLLPVRRGWMSFDTVRVLKPSAMGLISAMRQVPAPGRMLILPETIELPKVMLDTTSVARSRQRQIAAGRGGDDEFLGLRDYRYGDPIRRIDSKAWARLGDPMVKEFVSAGHPVLSLFVDLSDGVDGNDNSLNSGVRHELVEAGVIAAASIAEAVRSSEIEFRCCVFTGNTWHDVHGVDDVVVLLAQVQSEPVHFEQIQAENLQSELVRFGRGGESEPEPVVQPAFEIRSLIARLEDADVAVALTTRASAIHAEYGPVVRTLAATVFEFEVTEIDHGSAANDERRQGATNEGSDIRSNNVTELRPRGPHVAHAARLGARASPAALEGGLRELVESLNQTGRRYS